MPEWKKRVVYNLGHAVAYYVGTLISFLNYYNIYINTLYIIIIFLALFWNGAVYYIDFFSNRY